LIQIKAIYQPMTPPRTNDRHPQHVIAALAHLVEAGTPMPYQPLCRARAGVVWFALNDDALFRANLPQGIPVISPPGRSRTFGCAELATENWPHQHRRLATKKLSTEAHHWPHQHMPQRTKKFRSEAASGLAVTRSGMGN
jgi:hypothetical protein